MLIPAEIHQGCFVGAQQLCYMQFINLPGDARPVNTGSHTSCFVDHTSCKQDISVKKRQRPCLVLCSVSHVPCAQVELMLKSQAESPSLQ